MSLFENVAFVLTAIKSGGVMLQDIPSASEYLQKFYIRYVTSASSEVAQRYILGPRAFFIYLTARSGTYNAENIQSWLREMIKNASIMDICPTELIGGYHVEALRIFTYS